VSFLFHFHSPCRLRSIGNVSGAHDAPGAACHSISETRPTQSGSCISSHHNWVCTGLGLGRRCAWRLMARIEFASRDLWSAYSRPEEHSRSLNGYWPLSTITSAVQHTLPYTLSPSKHLHLHIAAVCAPESRDFAVAAALTVVMHHPSCKSEH
jgi:hypothetical protein